MTEIYKDGARVVSQFDADPTALTRRDHFAMAALTGLLSDNSLQPGDGDTYEEFVEATALSAYDYADAMEAARNKEGAE